MPEVGQRLRRSGCGGSMSGQRGYGKPRMGQARLNVIAQFPVLFCA